MWTNQIHKQLKGKHYESIYRTGLAMLACTVIAATAVNGPHAQNKALGRYAILELRAINRPDVFKVLHSKMGDFDSHTA
jgi:hypothetical protein